MLVGVTLSSNLDSSSSLAKAKRLVVVVNGCGQEGARVWGVAMTPALHVSVQHVQEHVHRQYQTDRQRLVCGVNASHGDSLLRAVVARSELLLLCMYGARVRNL